MATDFEEEAKKANDVETTVNFDKFLIGSGMDSKFTVSLVELRNIERIEQN